MKIENMVGRILYRALVVGFAGQAKCGSALWNCVCQCGKEYVVRGAQLRNGQRRSCGCLRRENHRKAITKHGWARTPEYRAWHKMHQRCQETNEHRKDYFDRGISVAPEWRGLDGFFRFLLHVGRRPENYSLDRINNDGGYIPGNVKWSTAKEQKANQRKRARLEEFSNEELLSECSKRGISCCH